MPRLEQSEIKKFWQIFQSLKPESNKLTHQKVTPVFKNSQLPESSLQKVWKLLDIDEDENLDFEEFCIAMKLILDTVNGSMGEIPEELPPWLIPGSKAAALKNKKQKNFSSESSNNANATVDDEDVDDGYGIRDANFDWYISPSDKATYEKIYNSATDRFGRIAFNSLQSLYDDLKGVPATDISSAWNLVNPKQFATIDRDQALVFLHILNQRAVGGKKVPSFVPASLRATFSKEVPEYDLDLVKKKMQDVQDNRDLNKGGTGSFGDNYLGRFGMQKEETKEIDYSDLESVEWETARLRKKLNELDSKIKKTEHELSSDHNNNDDAGMTKYEFEQLLKYKESQLRLLKKNSLNGASGNLTNLEIVKNDIDDIEQQVASLEQYLSEKRTELQSLS